ncbi:MAG: prepilin-type N-terminal cleavage/methylation domain-containing protein [Verrucomicrobiae bacterium]|nr:prepilin-type N-terminal cleavage/methylation domain-containing protein [Verrucomicrobiae bacterium]
MIRVRFRRRRAGAADGFTLVELLVVIIVVGVLASLLLPVMGRAKILARQVECAGRVRQWTLAQTLYAVDNDDRISRESFEPNGVSLNTWGEVTHPFARDVWYNALAVQMGVTRAAEYGLRSARPGFYGRARIFHCPQAPFPRQRLEDPSVFFSLAMNSKLIMWPHATVRITQVRSPSVTVAFLEKRLKDDAPAAPGQASDQLGQPSTYANRFAARHRGRDNLAYMDGHFETRRGPEIITNGLAY